MKKLLLLAFTLGLVLTAFAQRAKVQLQPSQVGSTPRSWKITDGGRDSILMKHVVTNDTVPYYLSVNMIPGSNDSGYFAGTGYYEFTRFAERYDFSAADSSIQVLGIYAALKGRAGSPSTHTAVFKVWNQGASFTVRPTFRYSGFPGSQIDSVVVPYSSLGFGMFMPYYFPTPTPYLSSSFFVGFSTNYSWDSMYGDTMSVYLTGQRLNPLYLVETGDTTVNDQTVIGDAWGWLDFGADLFTEPVNRNYWLFPIVNSKFAAIGVRGVTKKDFTFMGNYPNPCVNSTSIRFSLAGTTDVSLVVTDVSGRVISSEKYVRMAAGEHLIDLDTRNMSPGEYIYLITTTSGGGIASKITVVK